MKVNQNRTLYIIFQIIGVLVGLILIAAIVFSAYRFGRQRGMLAVSEAAVSSSDFENAPWAHPVLHWRHMSLFGNLLMVFVAIFLLRMVTGLILGFRPPLWRRFCCPRRFHRWYGLCLCDPSAPPCHEGKGSGTAKKDVSDS